MPKINELPSASSVGAADLFAIEDATGTNTRSATGQQIKDFATAGVAADVTALKAQLINWNAYDVLRPNATYTNAGSAVVYSWNAEKTECTVSGISSSNSALNLIVSQTSLPPGFVAGKTYTISQSTTDANIKFEILIYKNGATTGAESTRIANETIEFTIPTDCTGLFVRLFVAKNTQVNGVVSNLSIMTATSNKQLKEEIDSFNDTTETKINNKVNPIYSGDYKPSLKLTGPVLLGNYQAGETVDVTPLYQSGEHYTVLIDGLVEGEKFTVTARDGTTARPWAFLDKDNKLISMCDTYEATNANLIVPPNAFYLLVQVGTAAASAYTNAKIYRFLNLDKSNAEKIAHIYNGDYKQDLRLTQPVVLGNYAVGDVVDISPLFITGATHYTALIDNVIPGETFLVNAADGTIARPWAFLDKDYKLLSMCDGSSANNAVLIAPANARYLVVQVGAPHGSTSFYDKAIIKRFSSFDEYENNVRIVPLNGYSDMITKLENASNSAKSDTSTAVKSRNNLLNIIHFSDIHGDTNNISRLLDFESKYSTYISGILHTGDSVETYYGDDNPFAVIGGSNIMNVIGNHDCWIEGDTWPSPYNATEQQAYEKFIAPYISNWGVTSPGTNRCYYYKDYSTAKTRVIVLDCIHYDSTQETWFAGVLADAITNNLRVVAVTHYPAQSGITGFDCTFNCITRTISAVDTPAAGTQIERMPESAFTAIDTFINNGGEFVCWLSGHTHDDFIGVVNNHTNQIQIIISTGRTSNKYSDCARAINTKTEDLFNVFTVDGNAKLIKLIRVGSTMDKFMRKRETLCVNYATKQVISNN